MKRNKQERDFIKEWKRSSLWHRIIICLSAVVMLGTRYMLILPAATMEGGQAAGANAAEWERALPQSLSGVWAEDLTAVAESQIGYSESTGTEADTEDDGYTYYGNWYGDPCGEWNGMFLSFCLYYAQIPESAVPQEDAATDFKEAFDEKGIYENSDSYSPQTGDIAFLQGDQVGVVTDAAYGAVTVVAGDVDGSVATLQVQPAGYGNLSKAENIYKGTDEETNTPSQEEAVPSDDKENTDGTVEPSSGDEAIPSGDAENPGEDKEPSSGGTESSKDNVDEPTSDGAQKEQSSADDSVKQEENKSEEKETGDIDLEEYVLGRKMGKEEPVFEIKLVDTEGNEVEKGGEKYQIYEGEGYTFDFKMYAPGGIPDAGRYVYTMPEGITASAIKNENIAANDGTIIGRLIIEEEGNKVVLQMYDNTKIRLKLIFSVSVSFDKNEDGELVSPDIDIVSKPEPGQKGKVEKSGKINAEGRMEWTIKATIPGYENQYASWSIQDQGRWIKDYYPDLSKAVIILKNGNTEKVLSSAQDAAVADKMAYYWYDEKMKSELYFVSRTDSHEGCSGKAVEGIPEGWCTDWYLTGETTITIKYIEENEEMILSPGDKGENNVYLRKDEKDEDSRRIRYEIPYIVEKSNMSGSGQFKIIVNSGKIDLSRQEKLVVTDKMSDNIYYRKGSVEVTATAADGIEQVLNYGSDYVVEVSEELHVVKIQILHPGAFEYVITYYVTAESGSKGGNYENKVAVEAFGKEFEDSSEGTIGDTIFESMQYMLTVVKKDTDFGNLVPGATYGIFSLNGELLTEDTTDEKGSIAYKGDPSNGFYLSSNQLYYIQETKAPDHYQLSDTRYWFYYDDSDGEEVDCLIDTATKAGLYREGDKMLKVINCGDTEGPVDGGTDVAVPIEVEDQRIQYRLPETGSTGTSLYTIAGIVFVCGGACVLYRKNKKWRG